MGDADHVLDRHDLCEDNNPPHYPNDWDDKQWE